MKSLCHIIVLIATLMPVITSANNYESRVRDALNRISPNTDRGLTYITHENPETGQNDGELRIYRFQLGPREAHLIEQAKAIYQSISNDSRNGDVPHLYTLWLNTANQDRTYSGINLYYSPENSILVGADADNCYTVGFFLSEKSEYRNTYTLEWSNTSGDSVKGRVITTFGPVASKVHRLNISAGRWPLEHFIDTVAFKAQMEKMRTGMARLNDGMEQLRTATGSIVVTSSAKNSPASWMKKLLFYLDKIQRDGRDSRHIYLSKLYELCKNTDGLDQTDLKIALQQVTTCHKKLKSKNILQENELLFLQNMADVLQSRIE